jgi:Tol biopolymer transport system component
LAIYQYSTKDPFVELLDVSNPVKPYLACTLMPATGAHFLSDTKLAFWSGDQLGIADLSSGAPITQTARLAASAGTGAFSPDGKTFAYRHGDDAGSMSTHLYVGGNDRTLYVRQPLGGFGGIAPAFGPIDQLAFSPDGSLLLDRYAYVRDAEQSLTVFRTDGSIYFKSTTATNATWAPAGKTLYYFNPTQPGPTGDVHSLTADGDQVVATGVKGYFNPQMSPDGKSIVYNAPGSEWTSVSSSRSSLTDCVGVPNLWRLDLSTRRATQLSNSISSGPFFIQPTVVWSNEQVLGRCGPGGATTEDGVILAHDLRTGKDATVNTDLTIPGIGGPRLTIVNTRGLLDTWFAPA